jgi:hypothetical protein
MNISTYTVSWISSDDQTQSVLTEELDSIEEAIEFATLKQDDGELSVQVSTQSPNGTRVIL